MMATLDISAGSRVRHAEYGDGIVSFVVRNPINGDGSPSDRPYALVMFDDGAELLPTLADLTVTATADMPSVPAYAACVGFAPARPNSRHGIRPVSLYHFNIDGEGPFVVADGEASVYMPCKRCKGWGEYSQNDLDGSMCYGCYGSGLGTVTDWQSAQRIARRRKADRERLARAAMAERHAEAIAWHAFRADHLDVVAFLAGKEEQSGFIGDMARKAAQVTPLSERMVAAIRRTIGERTARDASRHAAGHVGTVGKRETLDVKVLTVRPIETQFGRSYLVIMETRDGAAVKTFGSGEWARTIEADPTTFVTIKATVKSHEEYQGMPQTMLTRVAAA